MRAELGRVLSRRNCGIRRRQRLVPRWQKPCAIWRAVSHLQVSSSCKCCASDICCRIDVGIILPVLCLYNVVTRASAACKMHLYARACGQLGTSC